LQWRRVADGECQQGPYSTLETSLIT